MKKILLSTLLVGLMSTSLMAIEGKINSIKVKNDGNIFVEILKVDTSVKENQLVGTADAVKAMLAMALTAKTSDATVQVYSGTVSEGTGWKTLILK